MAIFGLFNKQNKDDLGRGLEKTKESVVKRLSRAVMGKSSVDDEVLDNLEEALISSDVGVNTTLRASGMDPFPISTSTVPGANVYGAGAGPPVQNLFSCLINKFMKVNFGTSSSYNSRRLNFRLFARCTKALNLLNLPCQ